MPADRRIELAAVIGPMRGIHSPSLRYFSCLGVVGARSTKEGGLELLAVLRLFSPRCRSRHPFASY